MHPQNASLQIACVSHLDMDMDMTLFNEHEARQDSTHNRTFLRAGTLHDWSRSVLVYGSCMLNVISACEN